MVVGGAGDPKARVLWVGTLKVAHRLIACNSTESISSSQPGLIPCLTEGPPQACSCLTEKFCLAAAQG